MRCELELRFAFPDSIDVPGALEGLEWESDERCEDSRYASRSARGVWIRSRMRSGTLTTNSKREVMRTKIPELNVSVVLSTEDDTMRPQIGTRHPSDTAKYRNRTMRFGPLIIDLRELDDGTSRLEAEVVDDSSKESIVEHARDFLVFLFKSLCCSDIPMTLAELDEVTSMVSGFKLKSAYLDLPSSVCQNPHHVSAEELATTFGEWVLTPKIDGERRFICITRHGIYAVSRSLRINVMKDFGSAYTSLLDAEYRDRCLYIFDALVCNDVDVTLMPLVSRLDRALLVVPRISEACEEDTWAKGVYIKDYVAIHDVPSVGLLMDVAESDEACDGIVVVNGAGTYSSRQYKIKSYNTYDMEVHEGKVTTSDGVYYGTCNETDGIYEFLLDPLDNRGTTSQRPQYTPRVIRRRDDKRVANSSKAISSMISSVTLSDLRESCFDIMRRYHNEVKRVLLRSNVVHLRDPVLLDVGTGRGGDMLKWDGYNHVYCVEPSHKNLAEFYKRHAIPDHVRIINARVSRHDIVRNAIREALDVVTVFFSYMMFDDSDIQGLSRIIKSKANRNCIVQIITTDPAAIGDRIPHEGDVHVNGFTMARRGEDVEFTIPGSNVRGNVERIHSVDTFTNLLGSCGFRVTLAGVPMSGHVPLFFGAQELSSMYRVYELRRGYDGLRVPWFPSLTKCEAIGHEWSLAYVIDQSKGMVTGTKETRGSSCDAIVAHSQGSTRVRCDEETRQLFIKQCVIRYTKAATVVVA